MDEESLTTVEKCDYSDKEKLEEKLVNDDGRRFDNEPYEAIVKLSPSDVELSEFEDGGRTFQDDSDEVQIKDEIDSEYFESSSSHSDDANLSPSWNGSSDEEKEKKKVVKRKIGKETVGKRKGKRKEPSSPKPKRPRGRPKQPRRLNAPDGAADDYTSEEDEGAETKPVLRPGSGYPAEFKLKVLKYAETHSNAATAEKFELQPKRIRDWKKSKYKIEEESKGAWKRRPRTDGYTVEEKLQAVAFASERSTDEARLLYNVDRRTIEKWKAKKEQLEARLLNGEGNFIRRGGSGRKPRFTQIEENLRDWIVALRLKGVTVNYKMILNKAKVLMEEDSNMKDVRVPRTRTWVIGFLKRQNLHGLLGTTLGHEDPRELLNVELKTKDGDIQSLAEKLVEIPENPNKRNRRTISLEDKVNIIRRIEQGETQGTVAKSLKVATSTIQTIWSCRNDILHKYVNPKSKTKSDALLWKTYSAIGAALQDWLEQNVSKIVKIDCSTLMEKAIQLSETYRLPQFSSEAKHWLRIFCKRHSLPDVLAELKGNNFSGNVGNTTLQTPALLSHPPPQTQHLPLSTSNNNTAIDSVESNDHHDDDFHADFSFNDFLSAMHTDPQTRLHQSQSMHPSTQQQPLCSPNSSTMTTNMPFQNSTLSSEINNTQRFTTPSPAGHHPAITTVEAVKYITLLRSWVQSNYGPNEEVLNTHLSVIENAVLKRRMVEMGQGQNLGSHPH